MPWETEPGVALAYAAQLQHPFRQKPIISEKVQANMQRYKDLSAKQLRDDLRDRRCYWDKRARELRAESLRRIRALPDRYLRRLHLQGKNDHDDHPLGTFTHISLYEEMARTAKTVDVTYCAQLLEGLPIVGPTELSQRWPRLAAPSEEVDHVPALLNRAWEVQKAVREKVRSQRVEEGVLEQLWADLLRDVKEGTCIGPFMSQEEVSEQLGRSDWVPTARFAVVQKGGARGIDDCRASGINGTVLVGEKLRVTSTDDFVGVVKCLDRECQGPLAG